MTSDLVTSILAQYRLPVFGVHGVGHWARVQENGRRLTAATGARLPVVELFAIFHDSCRRNESRDWHRGRRGGELARSLRGVLSTWTTFALLFEACDRHTDNLRQWDVTLRICWDADRLDLMRVGIRTDPRRLGTEAARDPALLIWASTRAAEGRVPELVREAHLQFVCRLAALVDGDLQKLVACRMRPGQERRPPRLLRQRLFVELPPVGTDLQGIARRHGGLRGYFFSWP
jgi:uncharacterized protein